MEKLVLDCSAGARKAQLVDMLVELLDEEQRAAFVRAFGALGIPGLSSELDGEGRFAVLSGGRSEAEARHEHEHRSLADVRGIVESSNAGARVVADALGVYDVLACAEAKAHGTDVARVHFHEVGNDFAIGYIVAFCMLVDLLAPSVVQATPIATGFGFVDCAHGRLPIPAPATANILEGLPHFAGEVEGELCTPTGAALVRHFAEAFVE